MRENLTKKNMWTIHLVGQNNNSNRNLFRTKSKIYAKKYASDKHKLDLNGYAFYDIGTSMSLTMIAHTDDLIINNSIYVSVLIFMHAKRYCIV